MSSEPDSYAQSPHGSTAAPVLAQLRDTERVPPSLADPLVGELSGFLGPRGRHVAKRGRWTPITIVIAVLTVTFGFAVLQKAPCMEQGWNRAHWLPFRALCYSDVGYLYQERGLGYGRMPYFQSGTATTGGYPALEYPVLTGAFMEAGAQISYLITGHPNQFTSTVSIQSAASTYFTVNIVMLYLCALAMAICTVLTARGSPGSRGGRGAWTDALYAAGAPSLIATALINWDLFPVALTSGAMLAWARKRPYLAGVLLGLGTAAKFYPLFLLGPLALLCIRTRRLDAFAKCLGAGVVAWLAVNLPVMIFAWDGWKAFYTYNDSRQADYGSLWYLFTLDGHAMSLTLVDWVAGGCLVWACVGIAVVAFVAPRTPRLAQLCALVVIAFLLTNKVYSPQYVLWLVPLIALARPRLRDWLIWQGGEAFYWAMVWLHLAGFLTPGGGGVDWIYFLATGVRIGVQIFMAVQIVRDIFDPGRDPVRQGNIAADPGGGLLNYPRHSRAQHA